MSPAHAERCVALAGVAALAWVVSVSGQQPGCIPEHHPELWMQECTQTDCTWQQGAITLDAQWRWTNKDGESCYTVAERWDRDVCDDCVACAQQCALEGANYKETYGITVSEHKDAVTLKYGVHRSRRDPDYLDDVYGSRVFFMDGEDTYRVFRLKNREFTFEVEASSLACGMNGALNFVEMDRFGDRDDTNNRAGAKFGTGYCDASCPHDVTFIKGKANLPVTDGHCDRCHTHGACCAQMAVWEANSRASQYTARPCSGAGLTECAGSDCDAAGICDSEGCDYNSYRLGATGFYGRGTDFVLDTNLKVTVVTQFHTSDGTDAGDLVEIKRFYMQAGQVVPNSEAVILAEEGHYDSMTDGFCTAQKGLFGDVDYFSAKGGLRAMGEALDRGMVLAMSLRDDAEGEMCWLDARFPCRSSGGEPGSERGPCTGEQSSPSWLRETCQDAQVTFSALRVGCIGCTFGDRHSRRMSPTYV